MVAFDGAGEAATFRTSHHLYQIAVGKKIYQHLVAYTGVSSRSVKAQLFEHAGWRYAAAGLLKMPAHRQGNALQANRLVLDQAELHRVVTIRPGRRLFLHDYAGTRFDNSHRSDRSIRGKPLRHAQFSTDDPVNHKLISDFQLPISNLD